MERLRDIVTAVYQAFPTDRAMEALATLTTFDRYQASRGIESAASHLADLVERAGLHEVELLRFPADGIRRWWTFRTPMSWTPIAARFEILGDDPEPVAMYPEQACSVATNSAPTPPWGVEVTLREWRFPAGETDDLRGAAVVVPGPVDCLSAVLEQIEHRGALGFVTDAASSVDRRTGADQIGRLELSWDSKLFGFSLGRSAMFRVLAAAQRGARARATVIVDRSASMPVLTAAVRGDCDEEVLLLAHLCHPRPAANDNGSGVVALLGIAETLAAFARKLDGTDRRQGIRFLWAPEFVGSAAYLHDYVEAGRAPVPNYVVNLDMVGEDPLRCGGPLILERSPDHAPSFLDGLAERCLEYVSEIPGELPASSNWEWRLRPFVGTSDHAIFADPALGRPAIRLGHWTDPFKHTSADTIDKVSQEEIRRAAAAAGALAWYLATMTEGEASFIEQVTTTWAAQRVAEARRLATRGRSVAVVSEDTRPLSDARKLQDYTRSIVRRALRTCHVWRKGLASSTWAVHADRHRFIEVGPRRAGGDVYATHPPGVPDAVWRMWSGPFNLWAVLEDAPETDRHWIQAELAADKHAYAKMLAVAFAVNDTASRRTVLERAAWSAPVPLDPAFGERFLNVLYRAGWVG